MIPRTALLAWVSFWTGIQKEHLQGSYGSLADSAKTTLLLAARPERATLLEAERASRELRELNVCQPTTDTQRIAG